MCGANNIFELEAADYQQGFISQEIHMSIAYNFNFLKFVFFLSNSHMCMLLWVDIYKGTVCHSVNVKVKGPLIP